MQRKFKISTQQSKICGRFGWIVCGSDGKRAASMFFDYATRDAAYSAAFAILPCFDLIAD
jgi:hypothetical protein